MSKVKGIPTKILVLTLALLIVLGIGYGCIDTTRGAKGFPADYEVAVFRTADYGGPSYVEFYDENLDFIGMTDYPYVCLENLASPPCASEGVVYMPHRGDMYRRNGGQVIGISTSTGEVKEYNFGAKVLTATSDSIFIAGRPGAIITQIDKQTSETKEMRMGNGTIGHMTTAGEWVIAEHYRTGNADNTLLIFKDVSDTPREVELTGLGSIMAFSDVIDEKIYFGTSWQGAHDGTIAHTLSYYSLADNTIHTVLKNDGTISFVAEHDGHLFVAQRNIDVIEKNKVIIINKDTEEVVGTYAIGFLPDKQMEIHNDLLYILGYNTKTGKRCFAQYSIEGPQLTQLAQNNLNEDITKMGNDKGTGFFSTGMFFRD